jgi:hypothetical protein
MFDDDVLFFCSLHIVLGVCCTGGLDVKVNYGWGLALRGDLDADCFVPAIGLLVLVNVQLLESCLCFCAYHKLRSLIPRIHLCLVSGVLLLLLSVLLFDPNIDIIKEHLAKILQEYAGIS